MNTSNHPDFLQQSPQAALIVRTDGEIVSANLLALHLLRYTADQLSALPLWHLIPPEYHSLFQQTGRELAAHSGTEYELFALDREQQRIPVAVRISPLQDDLLGVELRDLRPVKEARGAHRRQTAVLRAVANASYQLFRSAQPEEEIPLVLAQLGNAADVSRVYIFENHWENGQRLLTSQRYEWCAAGIQPQIDDPTLQNFDYLAVGFDHFLATLQRGEVVSGRVRDFPPAEQAEFSRQGILSILIIPIFVQQQLWGFIGFDECRSERTWQPYEVDTLRTAANLFGAFFERRKAETALRASEELYRMLVENQGLGVALVDEGENFLYVNLETEKLFGVEPGTLTGRNLSEFLSADQMQVVLEQTALRRKGFRSHYEIEIVLPNQQRRILSVHATPHFDERGRFIGAFGVFTDITEQKRMEQRIRNLLMIEQSHRRESEALREAISALIHDLNSKQAAKQVLTGLARILPYDRCALYLQQRDRFYLAGKIGYPPGAPPPSLTAVHPLVQEIQSAVRFVNHIQDVRQLEWLGETGKGIAWMSIPLRWNNRPIGLIWAIRSAPSTFKNNEVALAETFAGPAALSIQNSRLYSQTQRLATLDPLTGLLNRRSIFEAGERELLRAHRYAEPFSLLVIDLDHFKEINDTYGHLIGDDLIKKVARRMKHALRSSDLIGRPGGDEFIVLLIKTTPAEAVTVAGRLLNALRERPFRLEGNTHHITASIGAAGLDDPSASLQSLIQRADAAMYTAKQNGGNQVQVG